ncbi:MAG: thiamine-phosphate kinase [Novosphingobium pentaromativorans]|uniref:Thiamine-monophosphate kinase n=1 Tax=Novosphingobium pentaromativorans TaxID=205844 RepID=A0A2W5NMV6_9SPHN|nr:thiamine-phosphate kinase [Novosphingobium panipatense]PZQ53818.1 MAG: thiamine-phosphate kinase [Novosphingobium pentaromativorans]
MSREFAFIDALRAIAVSPAARGLADDAAVLEFGGEKLVLTMDTLVEGVHFLPDDPPEDVAWKLVAVNASDLAAKGAEPLGCLKSHALGEEEWDRAFLAGLELACRHFHLPLLGGDTVRMPQGSARSFSLTALGRGPEDCPVPSRSGAQSGDLVWVSGTLGDSGLGLELLTSGRKVQTPEAAWLSDRYRRPMPEPALGVALAPLATAMMDVSDGLLVDARRMAEASGVSIAITAEHVPLSRAFVATLGDDLDKRISAMTAGDDYVLLFTAPPVNSAYVRAAAKTLGTGVHAVGTVTDGSGIVLEWKGAPIPLPDRLGYQH